MSIGPKRQSKEVIQTGLSEPRDSNASSNIFWRPPLCNSVDIGKPNRISCIGCLRLFDLFYLLFDTPFDFVKQVHGLGGSEQCYKQYNKPHQMFIVPNWLLRIQVLWDLYSDCGWAIIKYNQLYQPMQKDVVSAPVSATAQISRANLNQLRDKMTPTARPHNLIEMMELFPDSPHIHNLYREVSLHYQSPTLSYDQINSYILANLAKYNEESLYGRKAKLKNQSHQLRLKEPDSQDGVRVCLLKNICGNQPADEPQKSSPTKAHIADRIKSIVISHGTTGISNQNGDIVENVYALAMNYVQKFCQYRQEFIDRPIFLPSHGLGVVSKSSSPEKVKSNFWSPISFAYVIDGLVGMINGSNQFYLQIQSNVNLESKKDKANPLIYRNLIFQIPAKEGVIHLSAIDQQNWVIGCLNSIYYVCVQLGSISNESSKNVSSKVRKQVFTASGDSYQQTKPTKIGSFEQSPQKEKKQQIGYLSQVIPVNTPYYLLRTTNHNSLIIFDVQCMKVTNRIYHDTNFAHMAFNPIGSTIVASDYAGYLISMVFHEGYGDMEEEGVSYKQVSDGNKKEKKHIDTGRLSKISIHTEGDDGETQLKQFHETNYEESPDKMKDRTHYVILAKKDIKRIRQTTADPPMSKQRKTPFTKIVQNTGRKILQLIATKEHSIFTYESYGKIIKAWDLEALRVYQRIELTILISDLAVCSRGLILISKQKGSLSLYKFEKENITSRYQSAMQIVDIQQNSNSLFVELTNMQESIYYKIVLTNNPRLLEHSRRANAGSDKALRQLFMKNQVHFLNTKNPERHVLQTMGTFGELKEQVDSGLKNLFNMIECGERVILWGPHKVMIRGANNNMQVFNQVNEKGYQVFSNVVEEDNPNPRGQKPKNNHTQTINLFNRSLEIVNVKYFRPYITIAMKRINDYNNKKILIIDQRLLTISVNYENVSENLKIIGCSKQCALFKKSEQIATTTNNRQANPTVTTKISYFLFDNCAESVKWQSQQIWDWSLEQASLADIKQKSNKDKGETGVFAVIVCIYKSKKFAHNRNPAAKTNKDNLLRRSTSKQERFSFLDIESPLFMIAKYEVPIQFTSGKDHFINLSPNRKGESSQDLTYTVEQIIQRSMPLIIDVGKNLKLHKEHKPSHNMNVQYYKICLPLLQPESSKVYNSSVISHSQISSEDNIQKLITQEDMVSAWGKIAHYESSRELDNRKLKPDDGSMIFVIAYGGTLAIYQVLNDDQQDSRDNNLTKNIGVIDFNRGEENRDKIAAWDSDYKIEQERLWEQTKQKALFYVRKKQSKILSLASTQLKTTQNSPQKDIGFTLHSVQTSPEKQTTSSKNRISEFKEKFSLRLQEIASTPFSTIAKNTKQVVDKSVISSPTKKERAVSSVDPKMINQLFYKDYIQKKIAEDENETKLRLQSKMRGTRSERKFTREDVITRMETIRDSKPIENESLWRVASGTLAPTASNPTIRIKTESSISAIPSFQRASISRDSKKKSSSKMRFHTEALEQLERSKQLQKMILPEIMKSRNHVIAVQAARKKETYHEKLMAMQMSPTKRSRV